MDSLSNILKEELAYYAGEGAKCYGFPLFDEHHQTYGVAMVDLMIPQERVEIVIFARILNDLILIEEDYTDKPLYKALEHRGVSRQHIRLIYEGESYPDGAIPQDINPFIEKM